jgi:hypothetical protein
LSLSLPYSQISPEQASQADRVNVYTGVTCRADPSRNEPSVLLSRPQIRTGFGLSAFFLFCALECARVRISPTASSQAVSLNVYTGVTCRAKSRANEPSAVLWSSLAFFDRLWFSLSAATSDTSPQASIPVIMCSATSCTMKRGMSGHRRHFNAVYTVNYFYFLYIPFRFLTECRIGQILCRVYTRAAMLERQL